MLPSRSNFRPLDMPDGLRKMVVWPVFGSCFQMLPACGILAGRVLAERGERDVAEIDHAVVPRRHAFGQHAAAVEDEFELGACGHDALVSRRSRESRGIGRDTRRPTAPAMCRAQPGRACMNAFRTIAWFPYLLLVVQASWHLFIGLRTGRLAFVNAGPDLIHALQTRFRMRLAACIYVRSHNARAGAACCESVVYR